MTNDEMEIHDAGVRIVSEAVAGLVPKFAEKGLTPIAAFEGAVKGATISMMALNDCTTNEVADLLEEIADTLRRGDDKSERIMQ